MNNHMSCPCGTANRRFVSKCGVVTVRPIRKRHKNTTLHLTGAHSRAMRAWNSKCPINTQQLHNRHEAEKRLHRAQMTRLFSKKYPKQFRRRFKNRARSNRHIYTNKDMKM